MHSQEIFIQTWGLYLEKDGYCRKGNAYYHCLPDAQLIKLIRMENMGAGFYFIVASIACYADAIDMNEFKHRTIYDVSSIMDYLEKKHVCGMLIDRSLEQSLEEDRERFDRYFMPIVNDVNSVQDCYRFNKYVLGITGGDWRSLSSEDLLFESFQCGFYDETLQLAQRSYKSVRQRYQRAKYYHNHDGSISKEQLLAEEKDMQQYSEWIEDLRTGAYDRLANELQRRIDISRKSCSKFFAWRM